MTDTLDRLEGARSTYGVKKPCRVATTASITLSGLQSIDGVTVAEDDRVLVRTQSDSTQNGIYVAATSTWSRALDFDGNTDFVTGTLIPIASGTLYGGQIFRVTSADPQDVGTNAITFDLIDQATSPALTSVASATTTDLGAVLADAITITGTTTISSFGTSADTGAIKFLYFSGALTLTHGANLQIPGNQSISVAAGDRAIVRYDGSSVWRVLVFTRLDGQPLPTGQTTLASAATVDLGSVREQSITISGTTTITSFGTSAATGTVKFCTLSGAILLTNGANLVLPNGVNIQGASGDSFIARYEGSSVWRVLNYSRVTNYVTSTTDTGTTTAETDLVSHTIPAGRLAAAGEFMRARAWGTISTASTAVTRRIRLYFDGTAISDSAAISQAGGTWRIEADMVRETSTGVEASGAYLGSTGGTPFVTVNRAFVASTLGSSVELKVTGLCTASSGIITLTGFVVEYGSR